MEDEQILSCKIDVKVYKLMVDFCESRGMKIKRFVQDSLIGHLESVGRYGKKPTKQ